MKIVETHSHLHGLEFLQVNKPHLWKEVCSLMKATSLLNELTNDRLINSEDQWADILLDHEWTSHGTGRFVKDRVALQILPKTTESKPSSVYGVCLSAYIEDQIDVGIEVLPMKSMQSQMSSGVAYYEGELYNVVRNGRGVPAVPLVILGIEA